MPKIDELFAWVIVDTDEYDEGVPAFPGLDGMMMPMMGADSDRARSLKRMAQQMANATGKPIKLIHSTGIEILETVTPVENVMGRT